MHNVAVLTISDKGSKGERIDKTGALLITILEDEKFIITYYKIIPDEEDQIIKELCFLSDEREVNLILTNGGTGFSKRDITPEATLKVIEKNIPGFSEAMRMKSLEITPRAMLSRGV